MRQSYSLVLFVLSIFFVLSQWVIDISIIAMRYDYKMINLYGSFNPVDVYHGAVLVGFVCFFLLGVMFIKAER